MLGIGKVRKGIGANVRSFRKRAGLSQNKLGEKADLHLVYMGQVERGAKAGKRPKRRICGVERLFSACCSSVFDLALFSVGLGLVCAALKTLT